MADKNLNDEAKKLQEENLEQVEGGYHATVPFKTDLPKLGLRDSDLQKVTGGVVDPPDVDIYKPEIGDTVEWI